MDEVDVFLKENLPSVYYNQNSTLPFILKWGPASLDKDSEDDGDYDQKDQNAENTDGDDGARVHFLLLTPGDVSILIGSSQTR